MPNFRYEILTVNFSEESRARYLVTICDSVLEERIKKLLPTRRQWNNWSLPSKLTAIGAYAGISIIGESKDRNYRYVGIEDGSGVERFSIIMVVADSCLTSLFRMSVKIARKFNGSAMN